MLKTALLLAIICLAAAKPLAAQAVRGTLSDSAGVLLPAVQITLLDSTSSAVRTAVTDSAGSFVVRANGVGKHRLVVERSGFAAYTSEFFEIPDSLGVNVNVQITFDADAPIRLETLSVVAPPGERRQIVPSFNNRRSNTVQLEEMKSGPQTNAWEFVQSMRPHWLHLRGNVRLSGAPTAVKVYLDGMRASGGTEEALRSVPVGWINTMQFVDAVEAPMLFGIGHDNGAILIVTRKR